MLETLDAAAVRRWCAVGLAALRRHQGEIDELNVYPVPDGDTGTNLVLTLTSAQHALGMDLDTSPEGGATPHGHALRLVARGALLGARGNSGVILAQILRGLADALVATPVVRGRALAEALRGASAAARGAVAHPVEGTLLTVVAAAAAGATEAASDDLRVVAHAAAGAASRALARTPEQLPALARAGVVDAGGRGLCLLLDALVEVVTGEAPDRPAPERRPVRPPASAARETGSDAYAYEVQFLLDAEPAAVARMRATLDTLGDSLVVVGDDPPPGEPGTWNVHVHVNDVGAAVEAGVEAGRPYRISVTRFADQPTPTPTPTPDGAARAAVVVAPGAGIAAVFAREGAAVVPANPSIGELLDAVRATGAARVVVLPNDAATASVAGEVVRQAHPFGVKVSVVPTRSPVQALAALAVRDPSRSFEDDVIAMAEAAGACRYAEVCHARREALTVAGPCRPGDVLALVEGEVHLIGVDLLDTCTALLDRMLGGGGELVTLLTGADAPAGLVDAVRAHVTRRWPFVEVQAYAGGQPHYPLLVGVE
ncbi:DAK2 domain-containing protein [Micromonospora sp. NBRC 101691]|uniref:DAK2 domain-containing protein n=1 Tax=Micromonospora sp. NBRC 101691 TaxID=3032198 RepID=UPI0024A4CEA5|nr:DAK2 domain-containing protein [Micromonospora sp. NBRC 101691]GLY21111.1 dihydroxyacetone kinase [Micromonospora sp. NBRC 101691]